MPLTFEGVKLGIFKLIETRSFNVVNKFEIVNQV